MPRSRNQIFLSSAYPLQLISHEILTISKICNNIGTNSLNRVKKLKNVIIEIAFTKDILHLIEHISTSNRGPMLQGIYQVKYQ